MEDTKSPARLIQLDRMSSVDKHGWNNASGSHGGAGGRECMSPAAPGGVGAGIQCHGQISSYLPSAEHHMNTLLSDKDNWCPKASWPETLKGREGTRGTISKEEVSLQW
ncbi:hypothetical protein EYF80_010449 [Liparis tanakae]|uniref:Uncharacterized protein n=1 Tax=Liparis tanakae TaxID=230148 RepID=A0A4Z2IMX1_9TELE|nr:hypothetical protein EYF80_010449 [Liparis tanakae]